MNPPAQTRTLRQAVRFGLAMLVSAWALALAVPLLRYSDLATPEGQFFRTHRSGFAPLYALLGAQGARGVALLLGAGVVYGIVALGYWRLLQRLAARPDDVAAIWRSRWHWLLLVLVWLGWLLAYPLLSDDALLYLVQGRQLWLYGLNPWNLRPDALGSADTWQMLLGSSQNAASAYGPVAFYPLLPALRLSGDTLGGALLLLKFQQLVQLAACALVLGQVLRDQPSAVRHTLLLALLWHPVMMIEVVWNSHNDVLMMLWVLLALYAFQHQRLASAWIFLLVGAATKYVPLLCAPLLLAAHLQILPPLRSWLRQLSIALGAAACILVGIYLPFVWRYGTTLFNGLFAASDRINPSFGALVRTYGGLMLSDSIGRVSSSALLLALVIWQTARIWRGTPLSEGMLIVMLGFGFVCSLWYVPWYGLWPLFLAPLAQPWLRRAIILVTLLLPSYYIINIVSLPAWLLVLCNAGLPLLLLWRAWRTQQRRARLATTARL